MDASERKRLEERILGEVDTMLTEGDLTYLRGLSRAGLLQALETELKFLGLYSHNDQETPIVIHTFLENYIDRLREYYLSQKQDSMSSEQQPNPERKVQIEASPLIQTTSSTGNSILKTEVTRYIGFRPIQVSPIPA